LSRDKKRQSFRNDRLALIQNFDQLDHLIAYFATPRRKMFISMKIYGVFTCWDEVFPASDDLRAKLQPSGVIEAQCGSRSSTG